MYRVGIRLDDRWRPWVEQDLADPHWPRRYRVASLLVFAGTAVVLLPVFLRFALFRYAAGPFIGAVIGRLWFTRLKHQRARRLHLDEPSNPFTAGLDFRGRAAMVGAMFVLVLAGSVALIRVTHDVVSPCKDMSSLAETTIDRAGRDAVGFGDGASVVLEKATSDVVARKVSFAGAEPVTGVWAVRRDGTVLPLDQVARDATDPGRTGPGTTFGFPPGVLDKVEKARDCVG